MLRHLTPPNMVLTQGPFGIAFAIWQRAGHRKMLGRSESPAWLGAAQDVPPVENQQLVGALRFTNPVINGPLNGDTAGLACFVAEWTG